MFLRREIIGKGVCMDGGNLTRSAPTHTLILTGGGTAGHVWPHFALFDDPESSVSKMYAAGKLRVVYFGSAGGMERDIIGRNAPGWRYVPIATGKLRRYFSIQNFIDPFKIVFGVLQAFWVLSRLRPGVVFSKGGFVSAPVVWAAWLWRIPVVIHESDLSPALATKLTVPFARRALVSFDETRAFFAERFRAKVEMLGLPLRSSLFKGDRDEAIRHFSLDPARKTVLIFGGSLGAEALNRKLAEAFPELLTRYNIIHLVGKGKAFPVSAEGYYRQFEFLNDEMKLAYAAADLAVCRAGASSIFELAAARIPMILVPLGLHQSRGDQIENAKSFEKKGWAELLWEKDLDVDNIVALVSGAMASLEERKRALLGAPGAEAAQRVGDLLLSFLRPS
jgi:UDP-N-acetylglucosamine--N-acetylmuramyl-(pentapeptide) pyrophosphoryl-undecaprenol N-acetylglucosamine transferase